MRNPARQHAARVERVANDPARIERRKSIPPALFVERSVTYLPSEVLDAMEASEAQVPASHAARAKELRARWLGETP